MIPMNLGDVASAVGAVSSPAKPGLMIRRVVTDSRIVRAGDLFIAIRGPRFDGHAFVRQAFRAGAAAAICDMAGSSDDGPTAAEPCLRVTDTIRALGLLAAYYRKSVISKRTVVVAVTGSNGKTTTKAMIDHVLSESLPGSASPKSFNNHIGLPLTLLGVGSDDRYVIAEVGSNQPGEIASLAAMAKPDVAVISSIGEAHLEGLESMAGVAAEKASLLHFVSSTGLSVVNVDRSEIEPHLSSHLPGRLITFGLSPEAKLHVANVTGSIAETSFELEQRFSIRLPMPGLHHATNAAAAFAVARWFGLDPRQVVERFQSFVPPDGRTRRYELNGVVLVDDSYNANPASVLAAVKTLSGVSAHRRVLVLGDMLELGLQASDQHERVLRAVAQARIGLLVLVGDAMQKAWSDIAPTPASAVQVKAFADGEQAAREVCSILEPGDVVWVKASRAMQLDQVVVAIRHAFSHEVAVA